MSDQEKKRSGHKSYTPWHILLDDVMAYFFDINEIEVRAFEKLGSLPLESDFIILRKKKEDLGDRYPQFRFLLPYLGQMTVLEYKSPLDRLTFDDFDLLRVYRLLIKRKYKLKRDDQVWAVSLTSQFEKNYAEYIEGSGYGFKEIEPGVWGHEGDHDHFYWLDLATIGHRYPESFINLFSSNYRQYGQSLQFKEEDAEILTYIWQSIFREESIAMRHEKLRHLPEFTTSMEEIRKRLLESFSVEEILAKLTPEERLKGLKPEDVLKEFKPEERLKGLKPEEVFTGLSKSQLEQLKKLLENQS